MIYSVINKYRLTKFTIRGHVGLGEYGLENYPVGAFATLSEHEIPIPPIKKYGFSHKRLN